MESEVEIAKNLLVMDSHLLAMKCASKSRVKGAEKMCRNCHKKFQVLEKLGAHDCCHISFPKAVVLASMLS